MLAPAVRSDGSRLSGLGGGGHRLRDRVPAAGVAAIGQPGFHGRLLYRRRRRRDARLKLLLGLHPDADSGGCSGRPLRRQARGAVQHGGVLARKCGVRAGAEPARRFCRKTDHCLRRCAGFHRALEACRAEFQGRTVRHDVGHLAGVGLCRRRAGDDAAGRGGDRLWLARLLYLHRLRRRGEPRLCLGRAQAGSGGAQHQDLEGRARRQPAIAWRNWRTGDAP